MSEQSVPALWVSPRGRYLCAEHLPPEGPPAGWRKATRKDMRMHRVYDLALECDECRALAGWPYPEGWTPAADTLS